MPQMTEKGGGSNEPQMREALFNPGVVEKLSQLDRESVHFVLRLRLARGSAVALLAFPLAVETAGCIAVQIALMRASRRVDEVSRFARRFVACANLEDPRATSIRDDQPSDFHRSSSSTDQCY